MKFEIIQSRLQLIVALLYLCGDSSLPLATRGADGAIKEFDLTSYVAHSHGIIKAGFRSNLLTYSLNTGLFLKSFYQRAAHKNIIYN